LRNALATLEEALRKRLPNSFTYTNGNLIKQGFDEGVAKQAIATYENMELELIEQEEKRYGKKH
jgi:hypothetical protein